jgi:hypothetical protein
MVQESTATTDILVDFADRVHTLMDLKMFSIASFYSGTFFILIITESSAKEKKEYEIFYILSSWCYDIECKATFVPISFTGTTLKCVIFPWIIYLE